MNIGSMLNKKLHNFFLITTASNFVKRSLSILNKKKLLKKKKNTNKSSHSHLSLSHHIRTTKREQTKMRRRKKETNKKNQNFILKIKIGSMLNKNFDNFFITNTRSYVKRSLSILSTKRSC